jgi:hypothetical protein
MGCIAACIYIFQAGLLVLFGPFIIIFDTRNLADAQALLRPLIILIVASSIGWGIYKKNKIAAVAGLTLTFTAFILSLSYNGIKGKDTISDLVTAFMFLHSTRGIFAYHKIIKPTEMKEQKMV